LIHLGVTVQSAYYTLTENDSDAWLVVQNFYGSILDAATQRVLDFDKKSQVEWWENAVINAGRYLPTL